MSIKNYEESDALQQSVYLLFQQSSGVNVGYFPPLFLRLDPTLLLLL